MITIFFNILDVYLLQLAETLVNIMLVLIFINFHNERAGKKDQCHIVFELVTSDDWLGMYFVNFKINNYSINYDASRGKYYQYSRQTAVIYGKLRYHLNSIGAIFRGTNLFQGTLECNFLYSLERLIDKDHASYLVGYFTCYICV